MDINVCIGSACHLKGSYDVIEEFKKVIKELNLEKELTLKGAFCLNHCTQVVSVKVQDEVLSMSPENVRDYVIQLARENKWSI